MRGARGLGLAMVAMALAAGALGASLPPPRNPHLADSVYPLGHGDPGQQDALPVRGPEDPGRPLDAAEIQYAHVGPAHFGAYTSSPYPDGRRVHYGTPWGRVRLAPEAGRVGSASGP